ncbi:MAG: VPLPA-CTERM sorting domain-containing protein [Gammaproteobacteria bacterium]|nr:VPLPA-CTERM sorting domain-containing protein [Gammaproteobacteria bacterium]MDH5594675.1 VPLPA-CTERM sorting domain-containing protein [Gammaproteobacteria bacterium]
MKFGKRWFVGSLLVISITASSVSNAALVSRLGGLAYFDTESNLTWLADANYAQTSGYHVDGRMTWEQANLWATSLQVDGVDGWRLPSTLQPDLSCNIQSGSVSYGYNCTGSEMGNLFYNVLGNLASSLTDTGPFSNIQSYNYWSGTEYAPNISYAWNFFMEFGQQNTSNKATNFYAWAVKPGDVSTVPVPAAVWLFGSGLIGLVGFARRKKA